VSRYGFCWNETDHRRQAERDAERGRRDYDMYDRHTSDPCKEVYTEAFDRERRAIERREEEREQERREEDRLERAAQSRAAEQAEYERQQYKQRLYEEAERAYQEQEQQ